jgi:hypothetical protein
LLPTILLWLMTILLAQLSQFEAIEPSKCFKFNEDY